jgi:ribosomal protein S17E
VLNLGVHGFDIPYLTQRYQDVGSKYQPDLILWFESGTGFTRVSELEAIETTLCEEQLASEGVEDLSRCWETNKDAVQAKYSKQQLDDYIGGYLTHFLQDVESQDIPVFFYAFTHVPKQDLHTLQRWTSPYSNTQVIPTVPSIYEREGRLPDGHPNPAGHTLIAESIYQNLIDSYCTQ